DGDRAERSDVAFGRAGADGFERESFGGAAGTGEADHFGEFGIPDHRVAIAADAGAGGFEEAEARVCGDGGIDGGAASLESFDRGERGERMRGARGAVAAHRGG